MRYYADAKPIDALADRSYIIRHARRCAHRIECVSASDRLKHDGAARCCAGHRSAMIERSSIEHHAVSAHPAKSRFQTADAAHRGRFTNRATRIGAKCESAE